MVTILFPGTVQGSLLNHSKVFRLLPHTYWQTSLRRSQSCGSKPMSHSQLKVRIGNVLPTRVFLSSPRDPVSPAELRRKCVTTGRLFSSPFQVPGRSTSSLIFLSSLTHPCSRSCVLFFLLQNYTKFVAEEMAQKKRLLPIGEFNS